MNGTLDKLQRAMRARDPVAARRLFAELKAAGELTRAGLRADAGLLLRRGEPAGWLLSVLDGGCDQDALTPGVTPCALRCVIRPCDYAHSRLSSGALVKAGEPSCRR